MPLIYRAILNYNLGNRIDALNDLYYIEYVLNGDNEFKSGYKPMHLLKGLIFIDLGAFNLAKKEIKNYLFQSQEYYSTILNFERNYNDIDAWCYDLLQINDLEIIHDKFYELVYSASTESEIEKNKPWNGEGNVKSEIKKLFADK